MFAKILLLFSIINICLNAASSCSIKGIRNLNYVYKSKVSVFDNHDGIIETLPMKNVEDAWIENSDYLSAEVDEDFIVISTTPEFQNIEDDWTENPLSSTLVTVCDGEENRLEYILKIKNTNNHVPQFEKDLYEFIFYDIIPNTKETNLNEYEEIAATDFDFGDNKIIFGMEDNEYVRFKDSGVKDPNNAWRIIANLELKQSILAPFDKKIAITATDSGENSTTATSYIQITVLRSEAPNFTQPTYKARITKDKEIVMENEIAFENITKFDDLHFDISVEQDKFFNLNFDENKIKLEVTEGNNPSELVVKEHPYLYISIYAEGKSPEIYAETQVLLNMEELFSDGVSVGNDNKMRKESSDDGVSVGTSIGNNDENKQNPENLPIELSPDDNDEISEENAGDGVSVGISVGNNDENKQNPENLPIELSPDDNDEISEENAGDGVSVGTSIGNNDENKQNPENLPLEISSEEDGIDYLSTLPPYKRPPYALRGFRYWIDLNKTYIILFSVLTGCGVFIFFCIAIKRRNVRIS